MKSRWLLLLAILITNFLLAVGTIVTSIEVKELQQQVTKLQQSVEFLQQHDAPIVGSTPRSPEWPTVRAEHLKRHPICEACGTSSDLNVHHIIPFHLEHALELDPNNLITLCREHHWKIGHDPDGPDGPQKPNWSAANKNVRADAAWMRKKLKP